MAEINMQTMRYINLLDKTAKVKTTKCFIYNNTIFFAVPSDLVSKAIGPAAMNIKRIQESLGKKVRIVKEVFDSSRTEEFVKEIVSPVRFRSLEIKDGCITITAGNQQSKASLIGRNKRRLEELKKIIQDIFRLDLKII